MKLLEGRYVSPDKVIKLARFLGISEDLLAQIIIFSQMRDAIRNTSPRLYQSIKHRQEVLESILEALDEIEEEYEKDEEEEE
jgi:type III secretion protein W